MFIVYILLLVGFVLLVKGADLFVSGASSIAKLFRVSSLVIGLTIVSIGTSLPEASVSITAGLSGSNALALSNVIGSNFFNTAMVIGCCALIKPIIATPQIVKNEFPFMIIMSSVILFFVSDLYISRFDAFILFVLFISFMSYVLINALKNKEDSEEIETMSITKSIIFSIIGATGIMFGGDLVVDSAQKIALSFNVSENLIGLTIIAIGTSLPELVTSVVAAKKGESDMALGNVIGSNVFNLLFILSISALTTPISVGPESFYDCLLLLFVVIGVYLMAKFKQGISKSNGLILISSYVLYTLYIIMR